MRSLFCGEKLYTEAVLKLLFLLYNKGGKKQGADNVFKCKIVHSVIPNSFRNLGIKDPEINSG